MGQNRALFCLLTFFSHDNLTINDKSIDGVLGTRTWGGKMEGADESTELSLTLICLFHQSIKLNFT